MAIVSFDIPNALVAELNLIAQAEGFPNAKALVIHWLRAKIRAYRVNKARTDAEEAAGEAADTETGSIA